MNIHRKGKSGCEILINHFKNICPNSSFFIQILEILPGDGYKDGALDTEMSSLRKAREDFWMKTIRTIYPYGLCDIYKCDSKVSDDAPIGNLFPPLPRYGERLGGLDTRNRNVSRNVNENIYFSMSLILISIIYSKVSIPALALVPFVNILINYHIRYC